MSAKHTPGPWSYEGDALTHRCFQIAAPFGGEAGVYTHVATVNNLPHHLLIGRSPEKAKANARLIAAAPDLYAAAVDCLASAHDADSHANALNALRDALAKAEGR
jgi:apolipoprotein N-acyltransferase